MRFIIMGKASTGTERSVPPTAEAIAAMQQYNEDLAKAGVILAAEGTRGSTWAVSR
jgi:hypothetical protein